MTVPHPDVTRYFMTIPEAVQLVLRASTIARGGEIFVLDMGEPVKIVEMARDVIRLSGLEPDRDIEVSVTGLRPGEKLYEELWYADENVGPTEQDKLLVVRQPATHQFMEFLPQLSELEQYAVAGERGMLIQALRRILPEYQPLHSEFLAQRKILVVDDDPSRLLKQAHLRRWHPGALAAAYLEYAWTHLRWVPRPARAAWPFGRLTVPSEVEGHLDLFEQPGRKRVFRHRAKPKHFTAKRQRPDVRASEPQSLRGQHLSGQWSVRDLFSFAFLASFA